MQSLASSADRLNSLLKKLTAMIRSDKGRILDDPGLPKASHCNAGRQESIANVVAWASVFGKQRRVLLGSAMMGVNGRIQREGDVLNLVHILSQIYPRRLPA